MIGVFPVWLWVTIICALLLAAFVAGVVYFTGEGGHTSRRPILRGRGARAARRDWLGPIRRAARRDPWDDETEQLFDDMHAEDTGGFHAIRDVPPFTIPLPGHMFQQLSLNVPGPPDGDYEAPGPVEHDGSPPPAPAVPAPGPGDLYLPAPVVVHHDEYALPVRWHPDPDPEPDPAPVVVLTGAVAAIRTLPLDDYLNQLAASTAYHSGRRAIEAGDGA